MNLLTWALFGMIVIAILGIITNSGQTSLANISDQIGTVNCPMPAFSGLWNDTSTIPSGILNYTGKTYNYPNVGNQTITFTCTPYHTADEQDYAMGCPACVGWVVFIPDWFSVLTLKIQAFFTLVAYFLLPVNFDVFGYTLNDLSGVAVVVVVTIYLFAYVPIGILIYKALSPFSGGF